MDIMMPFVNRVRTGRQRKVANNSFPFGGGRCQKGVCSMKIACDDDDSQDVPHDDICLRCFQVSQVEAVDIKSVEQLECLH
jgi:hypothetical protein